MEPTINTPVSTSDSTPESKPAGNPVKKRFLQLNLGRIFDNPVIAK
jgi:hypothetical protein